MTLSLKLRGVDATPFIWFWPDGAPGCATMTHDVETSAGAAFCSKLMDMDDAAGIKAAFQIVPEDRYPATPALLDSIRRRGFELSRHRLVRLVASLFIPDSSEPATAAEMPEYTCNF